MSRQFDREFWEDRYRRQAVAHGGQVTPALVAAAGDLLPGTALDAGCGEGADALWLATRGWRVTAVDIASAALDRARAHAAVLGADVAGRVEWVRTDLVAEPPSAGPFDLVTSAYVHPPGSGAELFGRLAAAVAPGGTLLVVGHAAPEHQHEHAHPLEAQLTAAEVVAVLDPAGWEVLVAEERSRTVPDHSGGETFLRDVVVRARRRS